MRCRLWLAVFAVLAAVCACGNPASQPRTLAPVPAEPSPAIPAWIAEAAPRGVVADRAQIRVVFSDPLLPVGELGSAQEHGVLDHFRIAPALPGTFVLLTPRMVGFQADAALPAATRVRVTLTAGLRDLKNHELQRDLAWTFTTQPLVLATPQGEPTPQAVSLEPVVHIVSNAQIDPASLSAHARFVAATGGSVGASALLESPVPQAQQFVYDVSPQQPLRRATRYSLRVDAGVLPVRGNLPAEDGVQVDVTTYSPLEFAGVLPTADPMTSTRRPRFAGGDPALAFNNPLDPKTYAQHVHVTPALKPAGQQYSLSDDGTAILVNPYALTPGTSYTFDADAQMQDVFGQSLGSDVRHEYRTEALGPYFWAPAGLNRFVATQRLQLQYSAANLPSNTYRARYRVLSPAAMANTDEYSPGSLLPSPWPAHRIEGAKLNSVTAIDVPLARALGSSTGVLAYGAMSDAQSSFDYTGLVQLTNLGLFVQWFPEGGFVMTQRLDTGAPVAGARVDVYATNVYSSPAIPARLCASGRSGSSGSLTFSAEQLSNCYAGNRPESQAPELFTVVSTATDWAYVRTFDWSGIYEYGSNIDDSTWSDGQPIARGTIFSDRQLYQPGERAWLTALCYTLQNGTLHAVRNAAYRIVLRDPDGKETALPSRTTDRFASFSFPLDLSATQKPGYYTINAKGPDGAEMTGNFRVAEFRPPNFSVDLKLDRAFAAAGETVMAQGTGKYLFGAPMSGAPAILHITREPATLEPAGWDSFSFGRQWFWPQQRPDVSADAGNQTLTLDSSGDTRTHVQVAGDIPYALTYRVDLEAHDASNLASAATQTFLAVPTATLIGLRADFVGTVNAPVTTAVIATDPLGKVKPGTRVHVELQKMEYSGATQLVEGSEEARDQVRFTTVSQTDVTTAAQPVNALLQTKDAGSYRIRANLAGAVSDVSATDAQVWITGPGNAQWGQQNPSQLELKLDKQVYKTGDTAMLAVASPYDRADLYVSVIRDRVLFKTLVHVEGRAPRVRLPITAQMFPNAAVEGVLVRRGPAPGSRGAQPVDSLARIGVVPLQLDLREQSLTAKIVPSQARLQPHTQQHVRLELRDAAGNPVQGKFAVAVVNDAILQLSGYRFPDLVKTVFAAQPIATRFGDNRPQVTLTQPQDVAQKGWGYGGGFLAGASGTRVRTAFVPLAYFDGNVQTNSAGEAAVAFVLPDNLTTWRILAVAMTGETRPRFANSEATFITTKPLVTDPLLPQFARPGDRFDAGMLLMNSGTQPIDARTEALLSGVLSFASAGTKSMQVQQQFPGGMSAWRVPMLVNAPGSASLQVQTAIPGGPSDAFRVPLAIRTADVRESVFDGGATRAQASIPVTITVPGTVRIDIAGSLMPQIAAPAQAALAGDRFDLLTPLAARLGIAASILAVQRSTGSGIAGVDARGEAVNDVTVIGGMQRSDGGFAFWPHASASDAEGTADAIEALAYAAQNGIAVPKAWTAKAKPYLSRALADPAGAERWCTGAACKASLRLRMLRALAAAGDRRTDFLQELFSQRNILDAVGRVWLAQYLQQTPGWRTQADMLTAELRQSVYETGRYANVQPAAQAAYLELLLARRSDDAEVGRVLAALVSQQCRCGWAGVEGTADALHALALYAKVQPAADFQAEVLVDGRPAGSAAFHGKISAMRTFEFAHLQLGAHTIAVRKKGTGALNYQLTYSYALSADAPGRISGLRVRRIVRAIDDRAPLWTADLPAQPQPLAVSPGAVFDIEVQIISDRPVDRVAVVDPLPAGFEALDTAFRTTAAYYQPLAGDWQIDYQQIYRDRIAAFSQHLDPGVYSMHYLVRTVTPGEYLWPGTTAYLLNAPEQFGRAAFGRIRVTR
ncbi:MAG TPA: Ig-like domain-containing protein [Candidatus Baltobacteraceae bacterium]|nr:Ig-like domain-containing protein [Candidatus Baltobacteraceae bacterium]